MTSDHHVGVGRIVVAIDYFLELRAITIRPAIFDNRVGGPATAAVLASAIPGLAGFGAALLTLHLTVVPLGSATALVFALGISIAWNSAVYAIRRNEVAMR